MASIIDLPIHAPPIPPSWTPAENSGKTIAPLAKRTLLPVGPAYLSHVRRSVNDHSFEEHDRHLEEERKRHEELHGVGEEDDLGVGEEEETPDLLALDPKEWKKQDHYAVMGLSHLRYKATQDQIKIAHRKKVLKHHPDKKAGAAGQTNDDAFFKCIQKSLDVLTNPERRRQFDSVDPYYQDMESEAPSLPEAKKAVDKSSEEFIQLFSPIFEREARFSKTEPVPMLGTLKDGKDAVEGFYDFWYNFDSWRSFEYMDKEVNEGSDNRDDKRYTEKKNKADRARRKKEDNTRLRTLVDMAMAVDPRIKRIKQEEKEAREAKKKGKGKSNGTATPKVEDLAEKKRLEEEAKKKDEEEKAAKKKEKLAAANAAKKARRAERATTEPNGA